MLTRDLTSEELEATPSSVLKILDEQRAEIERLMAELKVQCDAKMEFFNAMNDIREERSTLEARITVAYTEIEALKSIMKNVWDKGMISITDHTDDEVAKLFANAIGYSYERKYK